MIKDGFMYLSVLVAFAALMVAFEKKFSSNRFFKFIPGIVLIYIGAAIMQTCGLFAHNESTASVYSNVKGALLPAMLAIMLLKCDIRSIFKLGPRMLGGFLVAVISIMIGFIVVYVAFQHFYIKDTWKAFGALAGSWTGGSANMVALQGILKVPENIFGYALMMDTINYAVWVMFMFWLVPFAGRFNRWTKADTSFIQKGFESASSEEQTGIQFQHLLYLLGIGLFISSFSTFAGQHLPEVGAVINGTSWTIMIASVIGLILGQTPVAKIAGALDVSNVMLYIIVALIASQSDFSNIAQAPIYLLSGLLIMLIHLIIMLLLGKLFKYDLFTLGVASLANIGGMASAPMLAAAYNRALIPIGVIMALIGSFLGTYFGMIVAKILSIF
ncbi:MULTISPECIES: DUF819 family protein [Heyndrickxia]|jgi:uncharacterized membrane protein|uniref:DUF819 family protein n=1 Tax=Heyndrickxia TaxID=2837504 RepID=UPI00242EC90D|nr:DUF819 family protein [Heyndrickxia oleronia]MCI1589969.1 DUF819 family protein [Heyndrickxia oleronia]MCI1613405.1 DUF819 family protein [Heyndrickxia oleronia]MCI1744687.1 DUF819 family protein [Heyndrickxia oleronia]MCI1761354.1 DUF819 family protein [Heyndrickxia oleronia]